MRPLQDWIGAALAALILIFFVLAFVDLADAAEIREADAVHAILGEARGEGWTWRAGKLRVYDMERGYRAMYAVACAIRNRGHLGGVDGRHAKLSGVSPEIHHLAARAWAESETGEDITHGADHWYAHKLCRPWWARYGTRTAVIGGHTYMKNVKKK